MKLHYPKILLFALPLNILLILYAHNKNKPSIITSHHTQTNRSLCECDTQSSIHDKDTGMKSVMQQFVDRTSQRFEEYKERLKEKRQKRKEQRDKNVQDIIEKDKREKSLEQKIEKGCLKCGCGLGGVAASVGVFGGLGVYGWKSAATSMAIEEAIAEGLVFGEAARIPAGINAVTEGLISTFKVQNIAGQSLGTYITATNYTDVSLISTSIYNEYEKLQSLLTLGRTGSGFGSVPSSDISFFSTVTKLRYLPGSVKGSTNSMNVIIKSHVNEIVTKAIASSEATKTAVTLSKTTEIQAAKVGTVDAISSSCQIAIIASVVALLIIVLVMIIIYLVLRYRKKKKMKKKAQYTKLLNQ
ncbi:rifin PIR protein,putative [Plasmodium sp. DRC-Itaito]|nr:rifin PIR protein,putative [Plasmodium sp. DRC-Itaito]